MTLLSKNERRRRVRAATEALDELVSKDDIVEETAILLELDVGDASNWIARFSCGLITVAHGDLRCELAFDDVEAWKPVAMRMIQGLYWMNQTGVS